MRRLRHHLPPAVIRSIVGTKGVRNIVITCDAAGLAGCPPGFYPLDKGEVEVLEDGRIVERGTHDELLGLGGRYRALYDVQLGERRE